MLKWLAVRCCCAPKKILGFLQVPEHARAGVPLEIRTKIDTDYFAACNSEQMHVPPNAVRRYQVELRIYGINSELAVYSDDRPIEFWREMNGFVEAE